MSSSTINATAASLLGFLASGPMTGWDLDKMVEQTISNFWNVTRSQVYRELRTLAALGYVVAGDSGPRERRPFMITEQGRQAFARWISQDPFPPIVRMPVLVTIFFGSHLPAGRLQEIVSSQIVEGEKVLEDFRSMQAVLDAADPWMAKVLDFGVRYQQMLLEWLRSIDAAQPGGR